MRVQPMTRNSRRVFQKRNVFHFALRHGKRLDQSLPRNHNPDIYQHDNSLVLRVIPVIIQVDDVDAFNALPDTSTEFKEVVAALQDRLPPILPHLIPAEYQPTLKDAEKYRKANTGKMASAALTSSKKEKLVTNTIIPSFSNGRIQANFSLRVRKGTVALPVKSFATAGKRGASSRDEKDGRQGQQHGRFFHSSNANTSTALNVLLPSIIPPPPSRVNSSTQNGNQYRQGDGHQISEELQEKKETSQPPQRWRNVQRSGIEVVVNLKVSKTEKRALDSENVV